jgi:hypothetical protein
MTDPEQVIAYYIDKLNNAESMEALVDMLDVGVDVVTLAEGIARIGVSRGLHSVDVSLLAAPVIHEFIVSLGEEAGIDFDEGIDDLEGAEKLAKDREKAKSAVALSQILEEKGIEIKSPNQTSPEADDLEVEETVFQDEGEMAIEPQGLMSRRM